MEDNSSRAVDAYENPSPDPGELRALTAIQDLALSVRAPEDLRARIEAARSRARPARRRRVIAGAGLAGAAAALAVALVLLLPAGAPVAPSVADAASLAVRGSASSAPASDAKAPDAWLDQRVGRVYFPNWSWRFGWTAVGQRVDRLGGRRMVTVYYEGHGTSVAYTIVSGSVLARPASRIDHSGGLEIRVLSVDGRLVVTWRRDGHTCVLSGMGVTAPELERLAAWS